MKWTWPCCSHVNCVHDTQVNLFVQLKGSQTNQLICSFDCFVANMKAHFQSTILFKSHFQTMFTFLFETFLSVIINCWRITYNGSYVENLVDAQKQHSYLSILVMQVTLFKDLRNSITGQTELMCFHFWTAFIQLQLCEKVTDSQLPPSRSWLCTHATD